MILLTQTDGRELRGEVEQDLKDSIIFKTEIGRLIINKDDIAEQKEVLNCGNLPLGTYVKVGDAVYLKINPSQFRLVKNLNGWHPAAIDTDRIDFGEIITHDEVFAPVEQPEVPQSEEA